MICHNFISIRILERLPFQNHFSITANLPR